MFDQDFDSHKLMLHPMEVGEWLSSGSTRGPIYTEFELTDQCNCRCTFCGVDYLVNKGIGAMPPERARKTISELADMGCKSVMFCGAGEPLLHPEAAEIIRFASEKMSTSVTTNGLCLNTENEHLIDGLEWIRFSINGTDADSYARIHCVAPEFFNHALDAVARAVRRKQTARLNVTIGVQLVLVRENAHDLLPFARRIKELGTGYFSVKPYSPHPFSKNRIDVDYGAFDETARELQSLVDENFHIICRTGSARRLGAQKNYGQCFGTNFMCYVSANGDIWECCAFVGDPRFLIGNTSQSTLPEIWHGERRKAVRHFMQTELDLSLCRDACRLDACNQYLWRLKHPWPHDNFI